MYFLAFTSSLFLSIIITGLARKVGFKFRFYQKPRKRDIHRKLIPRIGGIAIFVAFLIVSAILIYIFRDDYFTGRLWKKAIGLLAGGAIISLSMLWDDIRGLKPWQKFAFQFLAAFVVIASSSGIDYLSNPFGENVNLNSIYIPIATIHGVTYHFSLISDLLTLIWLVGMMN